MTTDKLEALERRIADWRARAKHADTDAFRYDSDQYAKGCANSYSAAADELEHTLAAIRAELGGVADAKGCWDDVQGYMPLSAGCVRCNGETLVAEGGFWRCPKCRAGYGEAS